MQLPGIEEVVQVPVGLEYATPDPCEGEVVGSIGEGQVGRFNQHPGDCDAVPQVDGQFEVRGAEEGVLAGQASDAAGQIGVSGQVAVPDLLVPSLVDAEESVTLAAIEIAAKGGLTCRRSQQQRLGRTAVSLQIQQCGPDDVLSQVAGGYSHGLIPHWPAGLGALAASDVLLGPAVSELSRSI